MAVVAINMVGILTKVCAKTYYSPAGNHKNQTGDIFKVETLQKNTSTRQISWKYYQLKVTVLKYEVGYECDTNLCRVVRNVTKCQTPIYGMCSTLLLQLLFSLALICAVLQCDSVT